VKCPNIHKIPGAGITIAQTLPELQGYALHVPDQVNFQERTTLPHHNILLMSDFENSNSNVRLERQTRTSNFKFQTSNTTLSPSKSASSNTNTSDNENYYYCRIRPAQSRKFPSTPWGISHFSNMDNFSILIYKFYDSINYNFASPDFPCTCARASRARSTICMA